jgi:hypothetical protein
MRNDLVLIAAIVAMLLCSSLMIGVGERPSLELRAAVAGDEVVIDYSMPSSTHGYQGTVVAVPISLHRQDDIAVVTTGRGGPFNSDPAKVQGLVDHLEAELENIGSDLGVLKVAERDLINYMAKGNGTIVVCGSLDPSLADPIEDWVRDGGVLVAIGPLSIPFNWHDGGPGIRYEPLIFDETVLGQDAGLGLRTVAPPMGVVKKDVDSLNGTVLGITYADLTTMARIPFGCGVILACGGPLLEPFRVSMEDVMAWDLAICLSLGAQWALDGPLHRYIDVPSGGYQGRFAVPDSDTIMSIAAYSLSDSQYLFRCLRIP